MLRVLSYVSLSTISLLSYNNLKMHNHRSAWEISQPPVTTLDLSK